MQNEPGQLLQELETFIRSGELYQVLTEGGPELWSTFDVDYEPPRVERLWRDLGPHRVALHRIHPCQKALYHPHPWPSAIALLSGVYTMAVGGERFEGARLKLRAPCYYEMVDPLGWHYVRPIGGLVYSVMLTMPPFERQVYDHSKFGKGIDRKTLEPHVAEEILREFQRLTEKYKP